MKAKETVKGATRKRKQEKIEGTVFSLHLPIVGYLKVKAAAKRCDLTMQEFVRRAVASAVFGVHYDHE